MIINRYIKMIKYLFMFIIIDAAALTKLFFIKIVYHYDISYNIVNNRDFMFTNVFWFTLYFHSRIKRRLNIAFHFQINDQIKRQNQILKHFLRMFVDDKQINWTKQLFIIKFVYINNWHIFINITSFHLIYKYHSEIRWEIENDNSKNKMSAVNERVKRL